MIRFVYRYSREMYTAWIYLAIFAFVSILCFVYLLGNFQCICALLSSLLTNKDDD